MRVARAMATAMRVVGNKEGQGCKAARMTTMAAATTTGAGTDSNKLKAAADKKSDYIRCNSMQAYHL